MKRGLHVGIAFVLIFALAFGMLGVATADGGDAEFTVSLVPTGTKTELNAEIVDANVGGVVNVDVMLVNNTDSAMSVNAFGIDILFEEGLTYNSIEWSVVGFPSEQTRPEKVRLSHYSGGDEGLIDIEAGGAVKLCTLTLDVANTGLVYGDQLDITVDTDSVYTCISIYDENIVYDEFYPSALDGKVEIVTKYSITWAGLVGNNETEQVGVGIVPTHDNPEKAGYTFTGWNDTNNASYSAGTPLPAVTANMTYTAQWTPTKYDVTFAEGTAFAAGVDIPTEYDIESGITVVPVQGGCSFLGWTAEPITPEDTDYNWNTATPPIATADTIGLYGDVKLTPVWEVTADLVFAEYAYAANGDLLLLVGINGIEDGKAVFYDGNAMFYTEDQYYLALLNAADGAFNGADANGKAATEYERAYLYLIPETATAAEVTAALTIDTGANIVIRRDGNVNCDEQGNINSGDYGKVDNFLAHRQVSGATVQMRLEADVKTSRYNVQRFGSIADIAEIIAKAPSF